MIRALRTLLLALAILLALSSQARPTATFRMDPACLSHDCNDPGLAEGCTAANSLPDGFDVSSPSALWYSALASDEPDSASAPVLEATSPFTPTDLIFLPYIAKPRPPLGWVRIGPTAGDALLDIDVAPNDSNRLYASSRTGIYRSLDRGATWELAMLGFFRQLVIDPQRPNILYTGPHDDTYRYGIYKSTDSGDTWTHYDEGMTCDNLYGLSIAATEPNILFTGSF